MKSEKEITMLEKVDQILESLVNLTHKEVSKVNEKGYFSKDFVEACRYCYLFSLWEMGK